MKLLGITLRRPRYAEFTAATVMAIGLWIALVALAPLAGEALGTAEAAALLVVSWWSCVAVRCGIDLAAGGWRHWMAHGTVAVALVLVNQAAWAIAG